MKASKFVPFDEGLSLPGDFDDNFDDGPSTVSLLIILFFIRLASLLESCLCSFSVRGAVRNVEICLSGLTYCSQNKIRCSLSEIKHNLAVPAVINFSSLNFEVDKLKLFQHI